MTRIILFLLSLCFASVAHAQSGLIPQNQVWAGPTSGGQGYARPRALVNADIPGGGAVVNGVNYPASPSTNTFPLVTSANQITYTALPNCTAGVLQYSTTTHLFSCGAIGTGSVTSVTCFGTAITTSGTCATAAAKSDQQAGTSATLVVTPSQQQAHDSALKAWLYVTQTGGTYTNAASYNVTSITKASTGIVTVTFTVPFATTAYAVSCMPGQTTPVTIQEVLGSKLAGSAQIEIQTISTTPVVADQGFSCMFAGRQ